MPPIDDLPKPNISDLPKPSISDLPKPPAPTLKERLMDLLPTGGSIIGGIGGGLSPIPGGSFIGSGAGGAAGESLKEYLQGKAQDPGSIATQGALGMAGEGAAKVFGAAAKMASPYLKPITDPIAGPISNWAARMATKAMGPYQKQILQLSGPDAIESLGQRALDEGLIGNVPVSYEKLAARAGAKKEEAGQALGAIEDKLGQLAGRYDHAGVPKDEIVNAVREKIISPEADLPTRIAENTRNENLLTDWQGRQKPNLNFQRVRELKKSADKGINWNRRFGEDVPASEVFDRGVYDTAKNTEENLARDIQLSTLGKDSNIFIPAKDRYGDLAALTGMGSQRSAREFANRVVSPSDYGVGSTVGLLKELSKDGTPQSAGLYGLLASLAHKVVRQYGNQVGAKQLTNLLSAPTATTTYRLLSQPEIRQSSWENMGGSQ